MTEEQISKNINLTLNTFGKRFQKEKEVNFADLPKFSPWPRRVLGLEEFAKRIKIREEALREYDREKWAQALEKFHNQSWDSFRKFRDSVLGAGYSLKPVFWKKKLFMLNSNNFSDLFGDLVADLLKRFLPVDTIVELGAGFGSVLLDLAARKELSGPRFIGGDLSENGIKLMNALAKRFSINVTSGFFDFTARYPGEIKFPQDSLIYTSFGLCCLPHIEEVFIQRLIEAKPKFVLHIEPVYPDLEGASLLDLMVRKYIEINDYNRNLLQLLKEEERKGEIQICALEKQIIGENPLFPASVIIWRPK